MDHGFQKGTERSKFFQLLKRPDKYPDSCCGEADAYEVDIDRHNPTGYSWLFVTWYSDKVGTVFCLTAIPEGS